jgi:hypothetical protein
MLAWGQISRTSMAEGRLVRPLPSSLAPARELAVTNPSCGFHPVIGYFRRVVPQALEAAVTVPFRDGTILVEEFKLTCRTN